MSSIKWIYVASPITSLKANEVFVFGSNRQGFHGAGAAFTAYTGRARGYHKTYAALYKTPGTVGHWAVLGTGSGLMHGTHGMSYAIPTVTFADGDVVTINDVAGELVQFLSFAKKNPQYKFIITDLGTKLAGFSHEEMDAAWASASKLVDMPLDSANLLFVTLDPEVGVSV